MRDVHEKLGEKGVAKTALSALQSSSEERKQGWDQFFLEIRQPEWWDGDAQPHPALEHEPVSRLERILTNGEFALTCEIVPPLSNDLSKLEEKIRELRKVVDGVNFTDGASAIPRVSPMTCSLHSMELGVEPVMQMAARDRTRLSFQADLMGASASGIRNLLLITGDHPNKGSQPFSRMDIWDFDSVQAIWMARKLRDEGLFLDGRQLSTPPSYYIGAAASPFASLPRYQAIRTEKKLNAGAQFFQTNLIFNIKRFTEYLEALDKRNILNRMHLIAGVTLVRSINAANYMNELPGVVIPDWIMSRLSESKDVSQESYQICLELLDQLKSLPGVQGIHFMAVNNTGLVKRIISDSNLRT